MNGFDADAGEQTDPLAELTDAVERLQIGIVSKLTLRYGSRMPRSDAMSLAMCTLCYALAIEPIGEPAKAFQVGNHALVHAEAMQLSRHEDVGLAVSYLYAAMTLLIAIQLRTPISDASMYLCRRAIELFVNIPNTFDICGSDDAFGCITALRAYATDYLTPSAEL